MDCIWPGRRRCHDKTVTTPDAREATADRLGEDYRGERHRLDDVGDREVVVFLRSEDG